MYEAGVCTFFVRLYYSIQSTCVTECAEQDAERIEDRTEHGYA